MVIVGSWNGDEPKLSHSVCRDIGMTDGYFICSQDELRAATSLVTHELHALSASMRAKPKAHFEEATTCRNELVATFDKITASGNISVPVLAEDLSTLKVAKVKFGKLQGEEKEIHVAVDPILLLIKAAIVLSSRFGERLLPVCPPLDDDWTEGHEEMALAYLERPRAKFVPPTEIKIPADGQMGQANDNDSF